ncbi:MAG: BamA/TamA family outer membrane protein [Bacteroidaceae bacterium]|nr:BamA/TamA family outer membrane protein [Bacteroidaceae bacterium]
MAKRKKYRQAAQLIKAIMLAVLMEACSSSKFIPEEKYLLDKVKIECETEAKINVAQLEGYIRQNPNARWFNAVKVPLGIYSLSGRDTSKWMNRTLQKIGEAPVLYDKTQTTRSCSDIRMALQNMGYLGAYVKTEEEYKKHKVTLTYHLYPGERHRVNKLTREIADTTIARLLEDSNNESLLREGMVLNINRLNEERVRITEYLQNRGYYKFTKEYITFTADTIEGEKQAALTMHIAPFRQEHQKEAGPHPRYTIGKVKVLTEFDIANIASQRLALFDTLTYKDINFHYKDKLWLRPRIFQENIYLQPGGIYRAWRVQHTYSSMARLTALKYTNIHFIERKDENTGNDLLDCYILTAPNREQSITAELEGTNTAGDLGAAASLTFQHKNLFKGSETFTFKIRGAYEAISGLQGYTNENYTEYGAEARLSFPRFMFPFLSSTFKRRIRASSEVGVQYNTQERPEFSRRVASATWSYRWTQRQKVQHKIDLLDINYVYMPSISATFKQEYLDNIASNSILKYNYEDLFIARTGYTYMYNSAGTNGMAEHKRTNFSLRTNIESAGNLLNLISHTLYTRKTANGQYALGNIAYAQYIKGDFDFTQHIVIDYRNSISLHARFGIAYPYGNSTILPFEKRYFAGGANSVRGWSVRSLGPGSYSGGDKNIDFINQSGDVKLDLSLEYRTFMFWKVNGALFIDAGNIWTLRSYTEQPGGAFRFNSFFQQIAVAYGIGFRFNFDYFILRFDGGMKAINPAYPTSSAEHYPIFKPDFDRDFTFHFAVGYPF